MSVSLFLVERGKEELEKPEFEETYGTIVEDIAVNASHWCTAYYPIFLLRRFVYAGILVTLYYYPLTQLMCCLFISIIPVLISKHLLDFHLSDCYSPFFRCKK